MIDYISMMWILLLATIALMIAIMIKTNPILRAKLMRKIRGKKYGIMFFVSGNDIYFKIKDFSKDIWKQGRKIYVCPIEFEKRLKSLDGESLKAVEADERIIKYADGIPVMFFDAEKLVPLDFSSNVPEHIKKLLAEKIGAILDKEIAVAEAEALIGTRKKLMMMLYIILIVTITIAAISLFSFLQAGKDVAVLNEIKSGITELLNRTEVLIPRGGV